MRVEINLSLFFRSRSAIYVRLGQPYVTGTYSELSLPLLLLTGNIKGLLNEALVDFLKGLLTHLTIYCDLKEYRWTIASSYSFFIKAIIT
ncbi:MAG: hypothetical protein U5K54_02665 [Cytophagales bacterium]|nr:hypothetical protein [Cytophagales bacterium]